ncbi:MAG: FtsX-like permease family protein [Anaerolineales bacterium]|nr:MAG: FtsX-like permease family protein [Anaerolineales bacterium]
MNLTESFRMSLRSLRANKMRSGLTMLGIIIGTGAVIGILSVGRGAEAAIMEQIQGIGANLIFILPGQLQQTGGRPTMRDWEPLTREDAEALADPERAIYVSAVAPNIERTVSVTYHGDSQQVRMIATTAEFEHVRNSPAEYGEFFTTGDEAAGARKAVIGAQTAEDFFGEPGLALEEPIRINGVPFKVVGVLESKGGGGFGGSQDAVVIVPLSTAMRRLFSGRFLSAGGQRVDVIYASAIDESSIDSAIDEITWVLRDRHDIEYEEDDFTVASQEELLDAMSQVTNVLTIFLSAVAGISLLVGGIGIMNIMLVSVTERTREIGIRKAVGARRSDILWQFLVEAIVLSVTGGLAGIGLGWALSALVNTLDAFVTHVSPQAVALGVGFSLAVGVFFGIYPASRASNLNPIDALRYE